MDESKGTGRRVAAPYCPLYSYFSLTHTFYPPWCSFAFKSKVTDTHRRYCKEFVRPAFPSPKKSIQCKLPVILTFCCL